MAIGAACLALAIVLRLAMNPLIGGGVPYVTAFPLMLVASLLGGRPAGLTFLIAAPIAVIYFVVPPSDAFSPHAADWIGAAAFLASGGVVLWLCDMLESTVRDLETAHSQEHLLVLELHHRVKNMLAIVQSLAAQTFRASGNSPDFKAAFTDRLVALGRAQNVLDAGSDTTLPLTELVRRIVEPFLGEELRRLSLDGPDVEIRRDVVVDLALCLHELGTNATKHGALSNTDGCIEVRWRRLNADRLELTWRESGGPPVTPPTADGFGARLLARGVSRKARPQVDTDYRPEGLVWTVRFDAEDR
ncbi:MAG: hypothetical protein DI570_13270 [Phenylobacterium zucineum]|nr:MAG: hypothetical protein DI570_13270 [Phenylobacterium zucineum]